MSTGIQQRPIWKVVATALRHRPVQVAVVYMLVGAVLALAVVVGFPALELGWEAQRLVLVLVALGFPVAVILAWAADATPRNLQVVKPPDAPRVWRRVQAEFFQLIDLPLAARTSRLSDLAGQDPHLAEEVEALLKAHEEPGALDELADRIAQVVPDAPTQVRTDQQPSTEPAADTHPPRGN